MAVKRRSTRRNTFNDNVTNTSPLPPHLEKLLVFYGALFAHPLAALVSRDMYLKIASHMCLLTRCKIETGTWLRGVARRHKQLFDNVGAIQQLPSMVLPQDSYKVDDDVQGGDMDTKMKWLRGVFLKDTRSERTRMLVVPFEEGLEEFVAECLVNNVLVFHEQEARDVEVVAAREPKKRKARSLVAKVERVDAASENEAPRDQATSRDRVYRKSHADTPQVIDTHVDIPDSDTDDTINEAINSSQLVVRAPENLVETCKAFSEKVLPHPSGDVLKLLEHTLEERNKLVLRVLSLEMELSRVSGC